MARKTAQTKRDVDSKGRVTLGPAFANRTVTVRQRGDEIILSLVRLIPEREAWLYENPEALDAVRRGLNQARVGKVVKKGPDLGAAADLADQLEGD